MSVVFNCVIDVLQKEDIPFLLIGGVAVGQYVSSRVTLDIDLAIQDTNAPRAIARLQGAGFTTLHESADFIRLHPPAGSAEVTDLLYLNEPTFRLLWQTRNQRVVSDRTIGVACPEHIIRMKLHALHYGKAERMKKDLPDILDLMPLCGWTPEHPAFLEACRKHATDAICGIVKERWQTWKK